MDSTTLLILSAFVVFLIVAVGAAVLLWVTLPVTISTLKAYLKRSIEEQEKTNRMLKEILDHNTHRSDQEADRHPEKRDNVH